jgi:hypothetical protein
MAFGGRQGRKGGFEIRPYMLSSQEPSQFPFIGRTGILPVPDGLDAHTTFHFHM